MNIIVALIISAIIFFEPSSEYGQLEIVFKDCRTGQLYDNEKIWLKDEEGKEIDLLLSHKKNKLKRLKLGTYKIEFESIFGRRELEEVFVKKGKIQTLKICGNKFSDDVEPIKQISIIDSLLVGERYQIIYDSQGCFHRDRDSIQITRGEMGYFVINNNHLVKVQAEGIKIIKDFELKLFNGKMEGACTTLDTYTVKYRDKWFLVNMDGSCSWNGFVYLKKSLSLE